MNVVLLAPSGSVAAALESLKIDRTDDRLTVISGTEHDVEGVLSVSLGHGALPAAGRVPLLLERSALGRNIMRLTPLDGGRRFAAAARRNVEFRRAIGDADLIVALERDSALAAWIGLRRWARPHARGVLGLAPARALISALRAN